MKNINKLVLIILFAIIVLLLLSVVKFFVGFQSMVTISLTILFIYEIIGDYDK